MLYKITREGKPTIYRNSAEEVAKLCGCSASNVNTRLSRKGIDHDIINGVWVEIVDVKTNPDESEQNNIRVIKFRGKRVDNGEWVYGDLIHGVSSRVYIKESIYTSNNIAVHPETVGQFTGLQDKNGVDIYEGDVVDINVPSKQKVQAEIQFDYGSLVMAMDEYSDRDFSTARKNCENIGLQLHDLLTVIGNIHDLKQQDESI